ncbi:GGDEF domain-containing protein [Thalassotalea euphylliae]|uniref:diguanylate cyclase n=1 Tax=Thalassotalea euphylliae TaxID=1655234 RepID=A0A3E0UBZ6_9GAMM|nr:GGDEF domain-containing protein [Thalassotalea euphylliae]REL34528.1 GGDEF domain-containing protein [Thalassotalea euphylliae]
MSSQDLQALKRTNTELKRAIRHFLEAAPNSGPLAVQVNNIKEAIKSNEAMFTFASLVEQYAKMKKNFDNVDYQNQKKDIAKFKAIVKKTGTRNLSSNQLEKVETLLAELNTAQPAHTVLMSAGQTIDYFATDLSNLRESSSVVVKAEDVVTDETGVVAADVHLASKKLLKDVVVVSKQLTKTYPNDEFISGILREASSVKEGKGTFFTAINLLERTTTYLTLLIQQERCATEEMLNDIHANLMNAISQTCVVKKLVDSSQDSCDKVSQSMANELQNMEVKAKSIDTLSGMQQHIKDSVSLIAKLMNSYSDEQKQIHRTNEATIQELTSQIESTSNFVDQLEKQLNVAEETSLIDELTTIGNRKGYVLRINDERKHWQITKQPLTLMVIDVDNFKSINDTYGHSIGDQVLKCLGQTLKKHIRNSDYVARFGGEEFVIILPATEIDRAVQIGQKIQGVINNLKFELRKKNKVLKMTCSFGIAGFSQKCSNSTDVFNLADKALYKAKENGRDCIVVAKDDKLVKVEAEKAMT